MITIVLTGGGSGGHLTPIIAVAHELKRHQPSVKLVYIAQKGDSLSEVVANDELISEVYYIRAGKFRRYHGTGWHQLLDFKTIGLNIRDAFFTIMGIWQSFRLLRRIRPAGIFIKGGFVGVPVGLAAALVRVPYVTHDSDAMPGLANRIIGRWARLHAVAMPKLHYPYPPEKTVVVGVPIQKDFVRVTSERQTRYRKQLDIATNAKVVLVTGGGLGAIRLNDAFVHSAKVLRDLHKNLVVLHVVGKNNVHSAQEAYQKQGFSIGTNVRVFGFTNELYALSGASDVIVTRAGATALAEFAAQSKACVVVPNPMLTGGHQIKNARALAEQGAIVVVEESTLPKGLTIAIEGLLAKKNERENLARQLSNFAVPNAAEHLAHIIIKSFQVS